MKEKDFGEEMREERGRDRDRDRDKKNGWDEYRLLVVRELERLNEEIVGMRVDLQKLDRDVLSLKIKASIWGAVAGFAVTMIPTIVRLLSPVPGR